MLAVVLHVSAAGRAGKEKEKGIYYLSMYLPLFVGFRVVVEEETKSSVQKQFEGGVRRRNDNYM